MTSLDAKSNRSLAPQHRKEPKSLFYSQQETPEDNGGGWFSRFIEYATYEPIIQQEQQQQHNAATTLNSAPSEALDGTVGAAPPRQRKNIFKNRYIRSCVFFIVCLCTTLVYYGWEDFQVMLYRNGVYRWKCSPAEQAALTRDETCTAQYDAVQTLFIIGLSSEFMFGVLAGIAVDSVGPIATSFLGNLMFFVGWMAMLYSTEFVQLYIPGIVLLAGSVNMIAFPCLEIGDLFPQKPGLAVSLVVAAQTGGTFVPVVLRNIWDALPGAASTGFASIVWGYLLVVFLPCFLLSMLCLPVLRFAVLRQRLVKKAANAHSSKSPLILEDGKETTVVSVVTNVATSAIADAVESGAASQRRGTATNEQQAQIDVVVVGPPLGSKGHEENYNGNSPQWLPSSPPSTREDHGLTAQSPEVAMVDVPAADLYQRHWSKESQSLAAKPSSMSCVAIGTSFIKEQSLWTQVMSTEYILFSIYYVVQVMQYGYFPTIIQGHFEKGVSTFQGAFLPSQALWGAAFGVVVDYIGTLAICMTLLVMMTLVYVMTFLTTLTSEYAASTLFIVSNAYIYTVKYTYISEHFPSTHFGFLVGLMGFFGGLFNLLNIAIKNFDFHSVSLGYLLIGVLGMVLIVYIWYRYRSTVSKGALEGLALQRDPLEATLPPSEASLPPPPSSASLPGAPPLKSPSTTTTTSMRSRTTTPTNGPSKQVQ